MATVQVKNVPPDVHRTLRERAAGSGQSLQEYLLAKLTEEARTPDLDEVFARIETRSGGSLSLESVVEDIRADRDARS